jgi:hypothetical protein
MSIEQHQDAVCHLFDTLAVELAQNTEQGFVFVAQFLAVCSASTLSEKRRMSTLFSRQSRKHRGAALRPRVYGYTNFDQLQSPIN